MVQVAAGGVGLLCQFGAVISCGVSYQKNVAVRISYIVGIGFAVLASHTAYENRFTFLQHLLLFGSDFRSVNRVADFQCEIVAGGKISSPVKRIDTQRSRYELTVAAFDILYENGFTAAPGLPVVLRAAASCRPLSESSLRLRGVLPDVGSARGMRRSIRIRAPMRSLS